MSDFPQQNFEAICYRSIELVDRNREYLELRLGTSGADKDIMQSLSDIHSSCVLLDRTVNEMMALLKCLHGEARPSLGKFDFYAYAQLLATQRGQIKKLLGIDFSVECLGTFEQFAVCADSKWVEQIYRHLLSNAFHACLDGGSVKVTLLRDGDNVVMRIADTGCGLSDSAASEKQKLANRSCFVGGAQAGLQLCREYCRILGWRLELSRGKKGTQVSLIMPAQKQSLEVTLREGSAFDAELYERSFGRFLEEELAARAAHGPVQA